MKKLRKLIEAVVTLANAFTRLIVMIYFLG